MQKPVRIPRTIPSTGEAALAPSEQISCMITSVVGRKASFAEKILPSMPSQEHEVSSEGLGASRGGEDFPFRRCDGRSEWPVRAQTAEFARCSQSLGG
jgi:hypothetical protein